MNPLHSRIFIGILSSLLVLSTAVPLDNTDDTKSSSQIKPNSNLNPISNSNSNPNPNPISNHNAPQANTNSQVNPNSNPSSIPKPAISNTNVNQDPIPHSNVNPNPNSPPKVNQNPQNANKSPNSQSNITPNSQSKPAAVSSPKKDTSIVYNVWEFAKVVGNVGRPNAPASPPQDDGIKSVADAPQASPAPSYSPCVFAIINCCHAHSLSRRNECFEYLGCDGAWIINQDICGDDYVNEVYQVLSFA